MKSDTRKIFIYRERLVEQDIANLEMFYTSTPKVGDINPI